MESRRSRRWGALGRLGSLLGGVVLGFALLLSPLGAGEPAGASGLIEEGPPLPPVIGKTDQEIRESWGSPRYIKVAPHDGDRRYAYFTLREWEQLGLLYPGSQGEDVYVAQDMGLQVHLRYEPVFDARNRFSPVFRVTMVTYVFDEPTPLSRLGEVLPHGGDGPGLAEADWFRLLSGGGRTVLVHWPAYRHPAADRVVPFRADPPVTLFWEVGLSVPAAAVDGDTPVNYVIEHLGQFRYGAEELQRIANPFASGR